MTTTPTNKPVPSEDPRDLKFNAGKFDEIVNSTSLNYTDRKGIVRLTHAGLQAQLKSATGAMAFANETLLKAYVPSQPNVLAQDTATGTFWYWNGSNWNKSVYQIYDKFSQNLFSSDLNNITTPGGYVQETADLATSGRHYPVARGGTLIVTSVGTSYVSQTYLTVSGSYVRQYALSSWSEWAKIGGAESPSLGTSDLNTVLSPGGFIQQTGSNATTGRNYPVMRGGTLLVSAFGTSYFVQTYFTVSGSYVRHYTGGVWEAWVQIGGTTSTVLGTSNLNDISSPGLYVQNQSSSATAGRNYPVARGGSLVVTYAASTNYISQVYYTISGMFVRHFATGSWSSWVPYASMDAVNAAIASGQSTANKVRMVVHGSSTLNYMNNELSALASKYGMAFLSGAVGGYTAQSTGSLTGQNKITVTFPGGTIPASSQVATNVTFSWNSMGLSSLAVTLSNGVKGALTAAGLFTANNLAEDLTDVSGQVFTATATNWQGEFRGTYIISIGKNNVSSSTNNASTIIGYIEELIAGLPSWTPFVLVGFFSNYGETTQHIANVEQINATLKAKYGVKFVDINKYILSDAPFIALGITKTPEDEAAIAARTLPPSLSRNSAHVSEPMDQLLTNLVESSLLTLGYVTA